MPDKKTKVAKKVYVDAEKYERLKKVLEIMNISITDYFDQMMTDFLDNLEESVLAQDSQSFISMILKNMGNMISDLGQEIGSDFDKENSLK